MLCSRCVLIADMFDENGDMLDMVDDDVDFFEPPVEEKPNEIMAELLREEKRGEYYFLGFERYVC